MASSRIKGTGLLLRLGEVDHWADATSVIMQVQDRSAQLDLSGRLSSAALWAFEVTAVQSTDPGSLWSLMFAHAYQDCPFVYAPHGNEEPTQSQPHFVGTLQLGHPPALGGQAGTAVEYVFTTRLPILGSPERVPA